jgi:membrane protein YqaA with SNARE-associated domain
MLLSELYWFIFFDELTGAILMPFNQKYVLSSSLVLNERLNIQYAYITAFGGAIMGSIINFLLTKIILNGFNFKHKINQKIRLVIISSLILLPLNFFGPIFSAFAAMIRLRFSFYFASISLVYFTYFLIKFLIFIN